MKFGLIMVGISLVGVAIFTYITWLLFVKESISLGQLFIDYGIGAAIAVPIALLAIWIGSLPAKEK
jgi:hypothetical protein